MGGVGWIDLSEDRNRWWAVVNAVMNLRVPENMGDFRKYGGFQKMWEISENMGILENVGDFRKYGDFRKCGDFRKYGGFQKMWGISENVEDFSTI
jgi:hypothetical protein